MPASVVCDFATGEAVGTLAVSIAGTAVVEAWGCARRPEEAPTDEEICGLDEAEDEGAGREGDGRLRLPKVLRLLEPWKEGFGDSEGEGEVSVVMFTASLRSPGFLSYREPLE